MCLTLLLPPHRNLTYYHRAALTATRKFWKILQQDTISLVTLAEAFRKIDLMEKLADKTYKLVLDRWALAWRRLHGGACTGRKGACMHAWRAPSCF